MERIEVLPSDETLDVPLSGTEAGQDSLWDEEAAVDTLEIDQPEQAEDLAEASAQRVGRAATRRTVGRKAPQQHEASRDDDYLDDTNVADPVRVYLNTIGKYPLLNAEQEVELAKTIEIGLLAHHKLEEARQAGQEIAGQLGAHLRRIAREGERAKERMLNSNLRLVVFTAKHPIYAQSGMPLLDRIQEGNIGLIRAVEKFDYVKGYKFSTYASWWIKQAIQRGIADKAYAVRLPVHQQDVYTNWRRVSRRLEDQLGREPTDEEILDAKREEAILTLRQEMAKRGERGEPTERQILTRTNLTLKQIAWAKKYKLASLASLDAEIGQGETGATLQDVVADTADDSEERLLARERHDLAHTLLDQLRADTGHDGPRMADIFLARMNKETLDDIGQRFGISRERVRQLERKAKGLLESLAKTQYKDYFEQ